MPSFTVDGRDYELLVLDDFDELTLGEIGLLETVGGISLGSFADSDGIDITAKLMIGLVLISMRRVNPDATVEQAGSLKVSVLNTLMEDVANSSDDAAPPTTPAANGHLDSASDSDSSPGSWSVSPSASGQ